VTGPVLVVGRTGQLATDLVAAGERLGVAMVALGRPDLDLTQPPSVLGAIDRIGPAAVINAAAYTAVDKAESEPELAFALNRDGPAELARACARTAIPLVHVSTDQVFDGSRSGGHTESDHPRPLCLYGHSKLEGERAVAAAGGAHLIVRVSWLFGPSGDNFVTKLLAWARQRETLSIVSDQRGRPTYSPAFADALIALAKGMIERRSAPPTGLLHLAGASVMTRYEQALAVVRASADRGGPTARILPVLTKDFPTPARRLLNAELDVSYAAQRFGIRLGPFPPDLETTLDRVVGTRETP
jgi:dTDP-4-dehydrorhamnose reductase